MSVSSFEYLFHAAYTVRVALCLCVVCICVRSDARAVCVCGASFARTLLRDSPPLPEVSPVPNRRTSGRVPTLSDRARANIATEAMLANRPELATKNAAGEDDDADFISV